MGRLGILAALALLTGACTATPITLPAAEDGGNWAARDAGSFDVMEAADVMPPGVDTDLLPDAGVGDGAALDASYSDGLQPDGMTDGGAGDAEAGPADDALTDDALTDLPGGDLTTGG